MNENCVDCLCRNCMNKNQCGCIDCEGTVDACLDHEKIQMRKMNKAGD